MDLEQLFCVCGHEAKRHLCEPGDDHCQDCVVDREDLEERCQAFEHDTYQDEQAWLRAEARS